MAQVAGLSPEQVVAAEKVGEPGKTVKEKGAAGARLFAQGALFFGKMVK